MAARKMTVLWMIVPITLFVMLGALFAVRSLFPDVREVSWNPMDRVISVDGVKIRYREYPDTERRDPRNRRPAIVLLHGFRGELDHWQPTMERLHGFRVIALDLVGFGGSDKPHISYDLDTQSRYLVQFLENIGVEKVVLVGISMGASLTAWTAAKVPEKVTGLIMIAPSGYPGTLYKEWPHSTFFKPGIVNRILCVIACSKWYRKIFPANLGAQTLTVTASYNSAFKEALRKISQPATLVWSPGDDTTLFEYSREYQKIIPQLELVEVSRALGHDVIRRDPEGTAAIIHRFVRGKVMGARP